MAAVSYDTAPWGTSATSRSSRPSPQTLLTRLLGVPLQMRGSSKAKPDILIACIAFGSNCRPNL